MTSSVSRAEAPAKGLDDGPRWIAKTRPRREKKKGANGGGKTGRLPVEALGDRLTIKGRDTSHSIGLALAMVAIID